MHESEDGVTKAILLWAITIGILPATTISFGSEGSVADSGEWNSAGQTLAIHAHPGWVSPLAGTSWVSFGTTGNPADPGYFVPPDGQIVSFYQAFTLPFQPVLGSVTFRADDSSALYVNNVLVRAEAPIVGNSYFRCSDYPVGCTLETQLTLDISAYLRQGSNLLRFDVAQRNGVSFGLNYAGFATGGSQPPDGDVPEPGSLALIGGGLLAIGYARLRKG